MRVGLETLEDGGGAARRGEKGALLKKKGDQEHDSVLGLKRRVCEGGGTENNSECFTNMPKCSG